MSNPTLVERLHASALLSHNGSPSDPLEKELCFIAAARIAELEAALMPFAEWSRKLDAEFGDHADDIIAGGISGLSITFGDLRRAARAEGEALRHELHKAPPSGIEGHARYWKPLADALKVPYDRIAELEAEIADRDSDWAHNLAVDLVAAGESEYAPDPRDARIAELEADVSILSREVRAQAEVNSHHREDRRAAVLAEREECTRIATSIVSDRTGPYYIEGWVECARELAIRIRARPTHELEAERAALSTEEEKA